MSDKVEFELVAPEKLLVSQPVTMVVVPGAEGSLGVLPGHAPMIVTVKPGVIDIYGNDMVTITQRIFVAGGFCEITAGRVTVLAEEASDLEALRRQDMGALEKQIADLAEDLEDAKTDGERHALEAKLMIAQAKLELHGQSVH
ncbi:ATP synthase F1 subunit epsilon [Niveispirillum sp. SYP-B3756]|uniref:ATP synthase F1 subunit epsilon n=1 Tax=Niveispirillum sp. SYP-B3756 TaxID=2662178 RepID=UPI0012913788|nr:ATP synthase F1 subunit epsilon [Niveispirillum sp. SYP-B3756]MQP65913.1 ATP synthase F1 subunit epsilon [Niveispirillum sp. SYP-B3756]